MTDAYATASIPVTRSPRAIAVDNFLRKALRVSDPRDPSQIANALLNRYPEEAERDRRERAGLPYASIGELLPIPMASGGATSAELVRAQDNLERDLLTLTTASQLKNVQVELNGWGRAIRQVANEGLAAARLALDPVQQDRALAARRSLTEYGRLGRYVGTLTEGSGMFFRRFAQSCDSLAGLILVAVGEGLAANGITRSTMMVRVAAAELQSRRAGVLTAFRGLMGWIESPLGQDEQPRGIEGYSRLFNALQENGQAELSYLLDENALAEAMNSLVDLSTGAGVDSLRELSTTSALLVQRFERLIQVADAVAAQASASQGLDAPPLAVFVSTLKLFVDAFKGRDSSRLLYLARPAILAGGLYDLAGSGGAARLTGLANDRALLFAQIESAAGCGCDFKAMSSEVVLDYLQYQVDRAIDLTASGKDLAGAGEAEMRAAAVGWIISRLPLLRDGQGQRYFRFNKGLSAVLASIAQRLLSPFIAAPALRARVQAAIIDELIGGSSEEKRSEDLVLSLSPGSFSTLFSLPAGEVVLPPLYQVPPLDIIRSDRSLIRSLLAEILRVDFLIDVDAVAGRRVPNTAERSLENIHLWLQDTFPPGGNGPGNGPGGGGAPNGGGHGGPQPNFGNPFDLDPFAEEFDPFDDPLDPDPHVGADPWRNSDPANLFAFYAKALGPVGGFSTKNPEGEWLRKFLAPKPNSGKLGDLVNWMSGGPRDEMRHTFIARMREVAAQLSEQGSRPQGLSDDELGTFFDMAPEVNKRFDAQDDNGDEHA